MEVKTKLLQKEGKEEDEGERSYDNWEGQETEKAGRERSEVPATYAVKAPKIVKETSSSTSSPGAATAARPP